MFGRRKDDDDPFSALKDGAIYQSTPTTISDTGVGGLGTGGLGTSGLGTESGKAPAATAAPGRKATPPMRTSPPGSVPPVVVRRRSRSFGVGLGTQIVIRLVVVAVVIAAIAVPLFNAGNAVRSISVPTVNFESSSGGASNSPSPKSAKPVSYLTPAGLRAGLAQVAKLEPGARLTVLRIDADTLSATAMLRNGAAKEIYLGPTGPQVTTGAATGQRPIPISQIRPSVVGRLVVEMGRRFHVAPNRIDYMVITSPPGLPAQWILFSKAPAHPGFSATLRGTDLRALGS
jgi:hypothetical protein